MNVLSMLKNSHQSGVYWLSGSVFKLKKNSAGTFAGIRDIKLCLVIVLLVVQIKLVYQFLQHRIILPFTKFLSTPNKKSVGVTTPTDFMKRKTAFGCFFQKLLSFDPIRRRGFWTQGQILFYFRIRITS